MQEDRPASSQPEPVRTESQRIRAFLTHENGNGKHGPKLLEFTDDNFVTEVLDVQDRLVVFDFWADYCVLCKFVLEAMKKLQHDLVDVKFGRVDVTKNPELVRAFDLKAIPHVVAILRGDVVMEVVGDKPYEELLERIKALNSAARTSTSRPSCPRPSSPSP